MSDKRVRILRQQESNPLRAFPYPGYPNRLEPRPISYRKTAADRDLQTELLKKAAVFGHAWLSSKQFDSLVRFVVRKGIYDPSRSVWKSAEEAVREVAWPFIQGRPNDDCPDTICPNHGRRGSMKVYSIFEEDSWEAARKLWGPNGSNLQVIHQFCPDCGAIQVTNQCT